MFVLTLSKVVNMQKLFFIASFFVAAFQVKAQNADSIFIKKLADEILTNGKAYENLRHLTKQIGGRLAGSPGMVKSEQWGMIVMKESGAENAWMQQCMVPHWVRGGEDQATFNVQAKKGYEKLDVVALGNSIGTGKNGLTAEVIKVDSFDELEKRKDEVKGKIVFYNYKFWLGF